MADAQLACGGQLNHIAPIDVHHPTKFGNYNVQEAIKIDRGRQGQGKAIDNTLAGFLHFDLSL